MSSVNPNGRPVGRGALVDDLFEAVKTLNDLRLSFADLSRVNQVAVTLTKHLRTLARQDDPRFEDL